MPGELKYTTFNTTKGWIGILGSSKGLLGTTLPQRSAQEARQLLGDRANHANWSPHQFEDLMERLGIYFDGHQVAFPDALDLSGATPFQRKVWETTRLIPYGKTRSYLWVAEQKNPLPIIIPCHRVITSGGSLGGFGGGVEMKGYLLSLEASASTK